MHRHRQGARLKGGRLLVAGVGGAEISQLWGKLDLEICVFDSLSKSNPTRIPRGSACTVGRGIVKLDSTPLTISAVCPSMKLPSLPPSPWCSLVLPISSLTAAPRALVQSLPRKTLRTRCEFSTFTTCFGSGAESAGMDFWTYDRIFGTDFLFCENFDRYFFSRFSRVENPAFWTRYIHSGRSS